MSAKFVGSADPGILVHGLADVGTPIQLVVAHALGAVDYGVSLVLGPAETVYVDVPVRVRRRSARQQLPRLHLMAAISATFLLLILVNQPAASLRLRRPTRRCLPPNLQLILKAVFLIHVRMVVRAHFILFFAASVLIVHFVI